MSTYFWVLAIWNVNLKRCLDKIWLLPSYCVDLTKFIFWPRFTTKCHFNVAVFSTKRYKCNTVLTGSNSDTYQISKCLICPLQKINDLWFMKFGTPKRAEAYFIGMASIKQKYAHQVLAQTVSTNAPWFCDIFWYFGEYACCVYI